MICSKQLLNAGYRAKWNLWRAYAQVVPRILHGIRVEVVRSGRPVLVGWPTVRAPGRHRGGTLRLEIAEGVALGSVRFRIAGGQCTVKLGPKADYADAVEFWLQNGTITIGPGAQVRSGATLRVYGDLSIGARTMISHFVVLHCGTRVSLGDDVTVAERASIVDGDHTADDESIYHAPVIADPVTVDDNVLLSAGVVVTRGVHLASKTIVAANSVVTKKHAWQPAKLIGGSPAKVLRAL